MGFGGLKKGSIKLGKGLYHFGFKKSRLFFSNRADKRVFDIFNPLAVRLCPKTYKAVFQEYKQKTSHTAKETLDTNNVVKELREKLETQEGDIATLKKQIPPKFKATTQAPEQEPEQEVVSKPYT